MPFILSPASLATVTTAGVPFRDASSPLFPLAAPQIPRPIPAAAMSAQTPAAYLRAALFFLARFLTSLMSSGEAGSSSAVPSGLASLAGFSAPAAAPATAAAVAAAAAAAAESDSEVVSSGLSSLTLSDFGLAPYLMRISRRIFSMRISSMSFSRSFSSSDLVAFSAAVAFSASRVFSPRSS